MVGSDGGVSERALALMGDALVRGDSACRDVASDISAVSANAAAAAACASSVAAAFAALAVELQGVEGLVALSHARLPGPGLRPPTVAVVVAGFGVLSSVVAS